MESFDFDAIPDLNKNLVIDVAFGESVGLHAKIIALGAGKTHACTGIILALGKRGVNTRIATAAGIVNEIIEDQDEKRLLAYVELLVIGDLGFVLLSKSGAEPLFELISQRH